MLATRSDKVDRRPSAISFSPFQNASSRLTLVLWPARTIERLMTGDFISHSPARRTQRPGNMGRFIDVIVTDRGALFQGIKYFRRFRYKNQCRTGKFILLLQ